MPPCEPNCEVGKSCGRTSTPARLRLPSPESILLIAYITAGFSFYMYLRPDDATGYTSLTAAISRYFAFGLGLFALASGTKATIQRPLVILALIPLLSLTYLLPLYHNIGYWGREDWDQYSTFSLILLKVMGEHGQLPLWNPYMCGGTVLMAYPNSLVIDPFILTELIFGVVAGIKINLLFYCIIGWYGCYTLAASLGFRPYSRHLLGMVFIMNGFMVEHIIEPGHIMHMPIVYVPYIIVYMRKSFLEMRYCVPCAIFLCLFIMGIHPFIATQTMLLLSLFVLTESTARLLSKPGKNDARPSHILQPVLAILTVATLTGLLFSFRLLPQMDYALSGFKLIEDVWFKYSYTGYGILTETVSSIGFVAFGLAIYGLLASLRRRALIPVMIFGVLSALISMNQNDPLQIWKTLSGLPLLENLRPVNKGMGLIMFAMSVFSAAGLSMVESRQPRLAKLLLVSCAILLFTSNTHILDGIFKIPPYSVNPTLNAFTLASVEHKYGSLKDARMNSEALPYVEAGVRTVGCFARGVGPVKAIKYDNPLYRGEAFLLKNRGNATITLFTPNRVEVAVNAKEADTLVINQNFEKNWKAEGGIKVESHGGRLSAKVTPNVRRVIFYYLPDLFLYGASLTALGITIVVSYILKYGPEIFSTTPNDGSNEGSRP